MGLPFPNVTKYQSSEIREELSALRRPQDWVVFPVLEGAMRVTPTSSTSMAAPWTEYVSWVPSRIYPAMPRAMLFTHP